MCAAEREMRNVVCSLENPSIYKVMKGCNVLGKYTGVLTHSLIRKNMSFTVVS